MIEVYFGDKAKTITNDAELKLLIEKAKEDVETAIQLNFKSFNPFAKREIGRWESNYWSDEGKYSDYYGSNDSLQTKVKNTIRHVKYAYTDVFPKATYLDSLKVDLSKGQIQESDICRYFTAYFDFLNLFEYQQGFDKYNISKQLHFSDIDIPNLRDKKLEYLCKLMHVDKTRLDYLIQVDPVFQYSMLDLNIDKEMMMFEMLIDKDDTNGKKYSNFYNTFVAQTLDYKKLLEYEIVKLSDKELSLNDYFNGELKQYMNKHTYNRVISKYILIYEKWYGKNLMNEIENNPIITKYQMSTIKND